MSKVYSFRVDIPCDDPVKQEAVKAIVLETVRALGARPMAAEAVDGEILAVAETTAFFLAASVKTFIGERRRAAAGRKV